MANSKSVVLCCAGLGSRLGLFKNKALININGRSLISWQLEMLKEVKDIRVVVGFQANEVIDEVMKYRKDVNFVYNNNYFETKTGTSFYLGARDAANEYVIELDGDLLVHPDDMQEILELDGEFIAYADVMSDDTVFLKLNENGEVVSFSNECGDYEWTGPACISKRKLDDTSGYVFNQLEPWLPMKGIKIRACDIDTNNDYERALKFIHSWED